MAKSTTTSHSHSNLLSNVSHIKKLNKPDDYVKWLQDQFTYISGSWCKFVCSQPEFSTDPDYIPYPDPLLSAPVPLPLDVVDVDEHTAGKTWAAAAAMATTATTSATASNIRLMAEHHEWTKGNNAAHHVIWVTIGQTWKHLFLLSSLQLASYMYVIIEIILKSDYDTVSYNNTTDLNN